jgi:hypothetical protein
LKASSIFPLKGYGILDKPEHIVHHVFALDDTGSENNGYEYFFKNITKAALQVWALKILLIFFSVFPTYLPTIDERSIRYRSSFNSLVIIASATVFHVPGLQQIAFTMSVIEFHALSKSFVMN